ncbi:MAG: hypothetical protein JNK75_12915 [Betaproteobacteria bacterium]|nr:hypothetical protein [Betaproteobacteria bacterium]
MRTPAPTRPRTYGDIDGFIVLLEVACEDAEINATLQQLLVLPDDRRHAAVHSLTLRLRQSGAEETLIEAIACLIDDEVAEQAYVRIFQCARGLA